MEQNETILNEQQDVDNQEIEQQEEQKVNDFMIL